MFKIKKLSKKITYLIVCAAVVIVLAATAFGLQIAFWAAHSLECWHPDYAMIDLDDLLNKSELSAKDYEILYRQTGLSNVGIDRALAHGENGKARIKKIQRDFFEPHTAKSGQVAPYTCTDYIEKFITNIYLEEGDIVITSSTHISGVRIGHAGLVVNAFTESVLEANAYGINSKIGNMSSYTNRINFMILRPNPELISASTVKNIVDFAAKNLTGIPYEGFAGVLTDKNEIKKTQCAHIIWYAFKQYGIDLDSNGGQMVMPKDLANSAYLQPVQTFGFDLDKLWK